MDRWSGRVALVTGASAGIGLALVKALVKHGMTVIGCARNIQKIEDAAKEIGSGKGSLTAVRCDLNNEDEILAMFSKIKTDFGGVDVCVNNAGLAHNAPLLSGETADWLEMLKVNILAPTIWSREAVKQMRDKEIHDCHIIIINSISGHRIVPLNHTHLYCMTKHAVTGLTESLRHELRADKSHIRVSAVSPGLVKTEFVGRLFRSEEEGNKRYAAFQCLEANDIVDSIVYILSDPPHVQVHDVLIRPTEQIT